MKKFLLTLCMAVASVALFTACDKEKDEENGSLVGSWMLDRIEWAEASGENGVEYFTKDESVWTFASDGKLTLTDADGEGGFSYETTTYSLSGDRVTFADFDGEETTMTVQKLTDTKLELRYADDEETEVYCFTRQ